MTRTADWTINKYLWLWSLLKSSCVMGFLSKWFKATHTYLIKVTSINLRGSELWHFFLRCWVPDSLGLNPTFWQTYCLKRLHWHSLIFTYKLQSAWLSPTEWHTMITWAIAKDRDNSLILPGTCRTTIILSLDSKVVLMSL